MKNLQKIIEEGTSLDNIYRVYEENSEIPLFYNSNLNGFENINYDRFVPADKFSKLYLIPGYKPPVELTGDETISFKISQIQNKSLLNKYYSWKGYDEFTFSNLTDNVDPNQEIKIPINKAKEWGLL